MYRCPACPASFHPYVRARACASYSSDPAGQAGQRYTVDPQGLLCPAKCPARPPGRGTPFPFCVLPSRQWVRVRRQKAGFPPRQRVREAVRRPGAGSDARGACPAAIAPARHRAPPGTGRDRGQHGRQAMHRATRPTPPPCRHSAGSAAGGQGASTGISRHASRSVFPGSIQRHSRRARSSRARCACRAGSAHAAAIPPGTPRPGSTVRLWTPRRLPPCPAQIDE